MSESVSTSIPATSKTVKTTKTAKPRAVKPRTAAGTKVAKAKKPTLTSPLSAEERHRLIAERAYLLAEKRGFQGGNSIEDWLAAEAEVDGPVKSKKGRRASASN